MFDELNAAEAPAGGLEPEPYVPPLGKPSNPSSGCRRSRLSSRGAWQRLRATHWPLVQTAVAGAEREKGHRAPGWLQLLRRLRNEDSRHAMAVTLDLLESVGKGL